MRYIDKEINNDKLTHYVISHVAQFTASFKERVQTECLYRFGVPVSPHLAAQMALETDVDVSEKVLCITSSDIAEPEL